METRLSMTQQVVPAVAVAALFCACGPTTIFTPTDPSDVRPPMELADVKVLDDGETPGPGYETIGTLEVGAEITCNTTMTTSKEAAKEIIDAYDKAHPELDDDMTAQEIVEHMAEMGDLPLNKACKVLPVFPQVPEKEEILVILLKGLNQGKLVKGAADAGGEVVFEMEHEVFKTRKKPTFGGAGTVSPELLVSVKTKAKVISPKKAEEPVIEDEFEDEGADEDGGEEVLVVAKKEEPEPEPEPDDEAEDDGKTGGEAADASPEPADEPLEAAATSGGKTEEVVVVKKEEPKKGGKKGKTEEAGASEPDAVAKAAQEAEQAAKKAAEAAKLAEEAAKLAQDAKKKAEQAQKAEEKKKADEEAKNKAAEDAAAKKKATEDAKKKAAEDAAAKKKADEEAKKKKQEGDKPALPEAEDPGEGNAQNVAQAKEIVKGWKKEIYACLHKSPELEQEGSAKITVYVDITGGLDAIAISPGPAKESHSCLMDTLGDLDFPSAGEMYQFSIKYKVTPK